MLSHYVDQKNHLIEVTISGKVTKEEFEKVIQEIQGPFETWPEIRLLKRVDSFEGIEFSALINDFKFFFQNLGNLKKIKKTAVVTDKDWVENLSEWLGPIFSGEVRVFENEDIEKARTWLV